MGSEEEMLNERLEVEKLAQDQANTHCIQHCNTVVHNGAAQYLHCTL